MSRPAVSRGLPVAGGLRGAARSADRIARWDEADRAARPAASAALRARFAAAGVDAYFGVRREHMRYLTGLRARRRRGEGRRQLRPVPASAATRSSSWPTRATRSRRAARRRTRGSSRRTTTCPRAGPSSWRRSGRAGSAVEAGVRLARALGAAGGRGARTSSSSRSRAGSRRTGRSRSRPRSSGSPPPARSRTGRSPRCCPRSGRASPRPTSRSASNG